MHYYGAFIFCRYQQMLLGADVFVLATHGEGWGRPLMEAMAMGLPVIAANWSGPTQFIKVGHRGLIFKLPVVVILSLLLQPGTGYLLPVTKLESAIALPGAPSDAQ